MADILHIIICLPTDERVLGARIAEGLTERGLHVSLIDNASKLQDLQPFAALCIGVTGRKRHLSLIETAIAVATRADRPILPLLMHNSRDLPNSLRDLQWSDFTHSFDYGWRELLLALDMEGLSHWPSEPSMFDS